MNIKIINLPETAIIGREGLCTAEKNVVSDLWQQANSLFFEVAELALKNEDGSFKGFWGAMSDEKMNFLPWEDGFTKGLYLAGVEVLKESEAPAGWTKWVLPARKYIVCDVDSDSYMQVFTAVINEEIPKLGLRLSGAVCDFTEPKTGRNRLLFPVD